MPTIGRPHRPGVLRPLAAGLALLIGSLIVDPAGAANANKSDGTGSNSSQSGPPIFIGGPLNANDVAGTLVGEDIHLLPDAWLVLEIGGWLPVEYDQIIASDQLHLDGVLELLLTDGFTPDAGDVFDVFDWGRLTGQFSEIVLPALSEGLAWDLSHLYADGEIGVVAPTTASPPTYAVRGPGTLALLGAGLAIGAWRLQRGQRSRTEERD